MARLKISHVLVCGFCILLIVYLHIWRKPVYQGVLRDVTESTQRQITLNTTTVKNISSTIRPFLRQTVTDIMITEMNDTEQVYPWGRMTTCADVTYPNADTYPDVSVIITFYDVETLSSLLHTVHSVIQRTPSQLLKEVILVDDGTKRDNLKFVLENYVELAFGDKVKIIRSPVGLGLIKARNLGFKAAKGQVVAVMDSHMEVQKHWYEALADEISKDRRTLAASFLDWMERAGDHWRYKHGPINWKTYFDWELTFGFMEIPKAEKDLREKDPRKGREALRTPTMIGGIFAIDRSFLEEIGYYDDGLEGWGGENVELSTKVWLCGGRVVNVPCSKVGHLEPGNRGYRGGKEWQDKIRRNYKRVSRLFGSHLKYVNIFRPDNANVSSGYMENRLKFISQCPRDFEWFLKNVFPEIGIPDKHSLAWGGLRNKKMDACIDTCYSFQPKLRACDPNNPAHQGLFLTTESILRLPVHYFITVDTRLNSSMTLANCISLAKPDVQRWYHWKGGPVLQVKSGLCLEGVGENLILRYCDLSNPGQQWTFKHYTPEYEAMSKSKEYVKKLKESIKELPGTNEYSAQISKLWKKITALRPPT